MQLFTNKTVNRNVLEIAFAIIKVDNFLIEFMDIEKIKQGVISIITSLNSPSLFVLGSGVSIRYANTFAQAKTKIQSDIIDGGVYLISTNNNPSELRKLLQMPTTEFEEYQDLSLWFYANTSTNEEFENLYLKHILPKRPQICPEYEIFNHSSSNSIIFDFNHDSLSEIFIKNKRLKIYYPHNRFPSYAHDFLHSLTEIQRGYNFNLFNAWGIHPPLPENKEILNTAPYLYLIKNFYQFKNINLIGYSFCDNGSALQDIYTFELITELAREHQKVINIINPNPDRLKEFIIRATNNKVIVNCIKLKWDVASRAILENSRYYPCSLLPSNRICKCSTILPILNYYLHLEENYDSIVH